MRVVTNTNIVIDDFDFCKDYPKNRFIHFLSHFHQDHYEGMTTKWDYGPIYCTEPTKRLILQKFPKVQNINVMDYNKIYYLDLISKMLVEKDQIEDFDQNISQMELDLNSTDQKIFDKKQLDHRDFIIKVCLLDAYHIPGSAMILLTGYMGTILNTGDFRFDQKMISSSPIFCPDQKKSIHVDEMIFDNTYCNPHFNFPKSDKVLKQMIQIIEKNPGKKVFVAMGALGKEDICVQLSEYFNTLIGIREDKLKQLESLELYRTDIFTTDLDKAWLIIIRKKDREKVIEEEKTKYLEQQKDIEHVNMYVKYNFICITTDFLMLQHKDPDGINFIVPYSLHSNYEEMKSLIKAVRPSILRRLVLGMYKNTKLRRAQKIQNIDFYLKYGSNILRKGESGYSQLKSEYTDFLTLSKKFQFWMKRDNQQFLLKILEIDIEPDSNLRKRRLKEIEEQVEEIRLEKKVNILILRLKHYQENLQDIANRLNSTNNNRNILEFLTIQDKKNKTQDQKITMSIDRFFGKKQEQQKDKNQSQQIKKDNYQQQKLFQTYGKNDIIEEEKNNKEEDQIKNENNDDNHKSDSKKNEIITQKGKSSYDQEINDLIIKFINQK